MTNTNLIKTLIGYSEETHYGAAHIARWNGALTAIGHKTAEPAMTLAEAEACYQRFNKQRWGPVVDAIKNIASTQPSVVNTSPNAALIEDLIAYSSETWYGADHVDRWKRALTALGHDTGEPAMTVAEVEDCYQSYSKQRWQPVLDAIHEQNGTSYIEPVDNPVARVDWSHLPAWTRQDATNYFRGQLGMTQFSGAYLEGRSWIFKHGLQYATRGYREYIVCDDGISRPVGKPLATESS